MLKTLAPKAYSLGVPFSYTSYVNTHWTTLVGCWACWRSCCR